MLKYKIPQIVTLTRFLCRRFEYHKADGRRTERIRELRGL